MSTSATTSILARSNTAPSTTQHSSLFIKDQGESPEESTALPEEGSLPPPRGANMSSQQNTSASHPANFSERSKPMQANHTVYRLTSARSLEALEATLERPKEIEEDLDIYLSDLRESAEISLSVTVKLGSLLFPDAPTYDQLKEIF
jgi:hypothetical protein